MRTRDFLFFAGGAGLTFFGIVLTYVWSPAGGISALLLLSLLILFLLILERRQVAKLQERVLMIIKTTSNQQLSSARDNVPGRTTDELTDERLDEVTIKKILGLLQAQQMSMEALDQRLSSLSATDDSSAE